MDEHSASSFPCSFWVVSELMYKPCHGHTQNEQFIRPHRLCQGLGPRTRTSMPRRQRLRPQAAPWSRTETGDGATLAGDVPSSGPSSSSSIPARRWWSRVSTAWRARCVISRSLSRPSRTRAPHLAATEQPVDTSTAAGKAFFDMLGVFAEFETNLRRERQAEGIAAAKQRATYRGRPPSIDMEAIKHRLARGLSPTAIARELRISRGTVYKARADMTDIA